MPFVWMIAALGLLLPAASLALPELPDLPGLPPEARATLPDLPMLPELPDISPPDLPPSLELPSEARPSLPSLLDLPSLPDLPEQASATLPELPQLPGLPEPGNPHGDLPPVDPTTPAGRDLHPLGAVPVGGVFVPEPTSAALLLLATLGMSRWRRRG